MMGCSMTLLLFSLYGFVLHGSDVAHFCLSACALLLYGVLCFQRLVYPCMFLSVVLLCLGGVCCVLLRCGRSMLCVICFSVRVKLSACVMPQCHVAVLGWQVPCICLFFKLIFFSFLVHAF